MMKIPNYIDIPSFYGRYVVLDTETTGLFCEGNHIIEIAAIEIKNGFLTGNQFHAFLKPRKKIDSKAYEKHKMNNNFFKEYYENVFESDKNIMINLMNFIGDSYIFAHNASFDMQFLNHELNYWNLTEIPIKNFRCTMRIFKNLFENCRFKHTKGNNLSGCCQFFNIKFDDKNLHSACYDAMLTAKLINSIFEFLNKNPNYITKRIVSNYSYLLTKSDFYGKKNNYSFLNTKNNTNDILTDETINENNNSHKQIKIDCQLANKFNNSIPNINSNNNCFDNSNDDQVFKSAEKNKMEIFNKNRVISAKKLNKNNEIELLVYETNNKSIFLNQNEDSNTFDDKSVKAINSINHMNFSNNYNNYKDNFQKINIKDENNINNLKSIFKEISNIKENSIINNNILNKNIDKFDSNQTSNIESKSNFNHERLDYLYENLIKNDLCENKSYNTNKIDNSFNNFNFNVSDFQIKNLHLIKNLNVISEDQIEEVNFNTMKTQRDIEEIKYYIEDNADEVYDLVERCSEDQALEIELFENDNLDNIHKNSYLIGNNKKDDYFFEKDDIINLINKDVFNISKINTPLLRSKVQLNNSNKLYND